VNSLRARLLLFLLTLAVVVAAVLGIATYRAVLRETDDLFDYQLRQMALSLRDQGYVAPDTQGAIDVEAFDYVVQIWADDGTVVYASHTAPSSPAATLPLLPARAVLGFSNIELSGARWRMFSAAARGRVIQVAQPLVIRRDRAAAAALRSVAPWLLAAPLVALAVWWLVGTSLAPLHAVTVATRKRAADSLAALPASGLPSEVAPLVEALNALLGRLRVSFDAQRAFVADAAHELRSPLTALKLQIDLLRRAPDDATRAHAMNELGRGVERAQRLVEQLLALARAEPGGAETMLAAIDLAETARLAAADSVPMAAARGAEIELDAPQPVSVLGEASALRVLIRNLIDNAVRYSGMGARVAIHVAHDKDLPLLRIDDSGPGIAPAERARVFDRFYRREGQDEAGSGLGLAIVRAIAQRHNASIELADSPLGGLRVDVRLPAARPEVVRSIPNAGLTFR